MCGNWVRFVKWGTACRARTGKLGSFRIFWSWAGVRLGSFRIIEARGNRDEA